VARGGREVLLRAPVRVAVEENEMSEKLLLVLYWMSVANAIVFGWSLHILVTQ